MNETQIKQRRLLYSQNNKIESLSNMRDTFLDKFTWCAKVCGLLFLDYAFRMLIGRLVKLRSHGLSLNSYNRTVRGTGLWSLGVGPHLLTFVFYPSFSFSTHFLFGGGDAKRDTPVPLPKTNYSKFLITNC